MEITVVHSVSKRRKKDEKYDPVSHRLEQFLCQMDARFFILLLVLLILPIFQPDTLEHLDNKIFIQVWRTWRLASCFVVLSMFFFIGRRDLFVYLVVLFSLSVLVSTLMNKGSVNEWVYRWIPIMTVVALVATLYNRRPRDLMTALFAVTFGMSVVNLASVFLFPEGTYGIAEGQPGQRFFFGNRNNTYQILMPAIVIGYLLDVVSKRRVPKRALCAFAVAIVQIAIMRATTTLLALCCLVLLLILVQKEAIRKVLNGLTYLVASLVVFIVVVLLRLENAFGFLIVDILHKDLTFTGRTDIWDMVLTLMDQAHSLWGYGLSGYKLFEDVHYTHAHNEFMNVWFVGGIVGVMLFMTILILVAYVLYRNRDAKTAAVIAAALAAFFVIGVAEQVTTPAFFLMCSFAFYVKPLFDILMTVTVCTDQEALFEES